MAIPETASEEPVVVPLRDPYGVAEAAGVALQGNPDDTDARGLYGQALCALKLFDAVGRLAVNSSATPRGGLIPWTSRARRFAANLRALEQRSPDGAALVRAAADSLSRYELHHSADGNYHILDTHAPLWAGWLGGQQGALTNHKLAERLWHYDPQQTPMPPPFLFDGLSFGWLFLHALRSTERAFLHYRCAFYILERDPLALAMALHIHDLQETILSPRTRWFIASTGEEVLSAFHAGLTNNAAWSLPQIIVRSTLRPNTHLPMEESLEDLRNARQKKNHAWTAESAAYYGDKDMEFWSSRFNGEVISPPLRVLGITSRYTTVLQHSMAEFQQAVTAWHSPTGQTAEMRTAIEPDDQSLENPMLRMIAEFKPDLIVQISRMRYENHLMPGNVPFLCWDQDNLPCMRTPEAAASLDALTFVAGHGAVFGYANQNWPRRNAIFCHAAGASHRYHAGPVTPELREASVCDFSYVSNASGSPSSLASQIRQRWDGQSQPLFDEMAEHISAYSDAGRTYDYVSIHRLVRETAAARGMNLPSEISHDMAMDLHRFGDRCFRHATLNWVSRFCLEHGKTLRLYGRGWEANPDFSRWASGVAEPGEQTRAIYQASRINLQIIESGFIHSRALDGIAAGGFFLTRRPLVFGVDPGEEMALYRLAMWAKQNRAFDETHIARIAPPPVQGWLRQTQDFFDRHGLRWALVRSLEIWAELPPAEAAIPHVNDILFSDQASFAAAAMHFLGDNDHRRIIAQDMREAVLASFSYDARWKLFFTSIADNLAQSSGPQRLAAASILAEASQ